MENVPGPSSIVPNDPERLEIALSRPAKLVAVVETVPAYAAEPEASDPNKARIAHMLQLSRHALFARSFITPPSNWLSKVMAAQEGQGI
jgi:hypothetical protein